MFTTPLKEGWPEAVAFVKNKVPVGSTLDTAGWQRVPQELRDNAFFSAKIEDGRFVAEMHHWLGEYLAGARTEVVLPDGTRTTMLTAAGRAQFVQDFRRQAQRMGLDALVPPEKRGGLEDITSERRLGLIFDVQTESAYGYGDWLQGMDPDVLNEFPAWRFIRVGEPQAPRPVHQAHVNEVRLKTDLPFWLAMNDPSFGGFNRPFSPWGFGSLMDTEDVDRGEAEALGLLQPGQRLEPATRDFNEGLKASVRNLDDRTLNWLRRELGDTVAFEGDHVRWVKQNTEQERQDDESKRTGTARGNGGRQAGGAGNDARGIAGRARGIFAGLRSGDDGAAPAAGPAAAPALLTAADAAAAGAHVAAVAVGRKPLFHEQLPWALAAARALRAALPGGVTVAHVGDHLYVYRPAVLRRVLELAPEQYPGESPLDQIHRATLAGTNGLLLGYGTPTLLGAKLVTVRLLDAAGEVVGGFRTPAATAEHWARERLRDFTDAYGPDAGYRYEILGATP